MRIGILSDSHDNLAAIAKAVAFFNDAEVDLVVHAGDLISPFVSIPLKELKSDFVAVFGNNDGEKLGLHQALRGRIHRPPHFITPAGLRVAVLHEPDHLEVLAQSGAYDAIIYGHTHKVDIRQEKTIIINPGECGGWVQGKRTVALWDIPQKKVESIPL